MIMALLAIPSVALWSYSVAGLVLASWCVATLLRDDWSRTRGLDKLILSSIDDGFNYVADTLMFCGAVLLLAGAMPREAWQREASAIALQPRG